MTGVEIKDNAVVVNGNTIDVGSRILDAQATASIVLILIDPDSYLATRGRARIRPTPHG
jgi:hypothetical protein